MEPALIRLRLATALLLATVAVPALAEPRPSIDQRVDKVEKELRAVQRKVFPGGSPAFFEPEIAPSTAAPPPVNTSNNNAPLNELTSRIDALERTVAQLTGQIEQDEHRLNLLTEQASKERADFDARLKLLEGGGVAAPPPGTQPPFVDAAAPTSSPFGRPSTPLGTRPGKPGAAAPAPYAAGSAKPTTTSPARPAATRPVEEDPAPVVSASGDAGEDAYMAGYRLWDAKKYGEARTALKAFLAKYPKHRRASYAQNLIGRSYLDEGSPGNAAEAFAANYQTNPRGERAQESLYYLGQSLMKLNKPADACRVYAEIDDAYGDKVPDNLKTRIAAGRKEAKCK
jgi:TolA-binding protein